MCHTVDLTWSSFSQPGLNCVLHNAGFILNRSEYFLAVSEEEGESDDDNHQDGQAEKKQDAAAEPSSQFCVVGSALKKRDVPAVHGEIRTRGRSILLDEKMAS